MQPYIPQNSDVELKRTDVLHARIGNTKVRYFVGEPVVVPIILSNHTSIPITVRTNFNPRSRLSVTIRQLGQPERIYYGPYSPGTYPMREFFLYPLDEYRSNFVIWSDLNERTGLAFPEPGQYAIELRQEVDIVIEPRSLGKAERVVSGPIVIGTMAILVEETPAPLRGFVDALKQNPQATRSLQNRETPAGWEDRLSNDIKNLPITALTPFIYLAWADHLQKRWEQMHGNPALAGEIADNALLYYQLAAHSDWAYKLESYDALLSFLDRIRAIKVATIIAQELLDNLPKDMLGKLRSPLLEKYLVTTTEIDQIQYWQLYE